MDNNKDSKNSTNNMDSSKNSMEDKQVDNSKNSMEGKQASTKQTGTLAKAMQLVSDHSDPITTDELLDMTAAIGDFMSETRENLQEDSERYQEAGDEEGDAEEAYMKLMGELSEEQKTAVRRYVDAVEGLHLIGSDIAYLAGLQDCVKLMRWIGLLK